MQPPSHATGHAAPPRRRRRVVGVAIAFLLLAGVISLAILSYPWGRCIRVRGVVDRLAGADDRAAAFYYRRESLRSYEVTWLLRTAGDFRLDAGTRSCAFEVLATEARAEDTEALHAMASSDRSPFIRSMAWLTLASLTRRADVRVDLGEALAKEADEDVKRSIRIAMAFAHHPEAQRLFEELLSKSGLPTYDERVLLLALEAAQGDGRFTQWKKHFLAVEGPNDHIEFFEFIANVFLTAEEKLALLEWMGQAAPASARTAEWGSKRFRWHLGQRTFRPSDE